MSGSIKGFDKVNGIKEVTATTSGTSTALDVNVVGGAGGGSDATAANQATQIANQATQIANLTAQLAELSIIKDASIVNVDWDYYDITYVASGNGVGEIETTTYYTGTPGLGTVALTITLSYNSNGDVIRIERV